MQPEDLDAVLSIENTVYPHPWTRGNFKDALQSGYQAWVAREEVGNVLGYFLLMVVLDEGHLLNISVRLDLHGCGFGRALLARVVSMARELGLASILLEVRPSNTRAITLYGHAGFMSIGRRKAYYPADENVREDAIVMRLSL
ncbi:MAG: ribosomal protein S18-alanine N-acetyltransferase [Glaciimonas sp.]|nr:ribosomal protein S18-alanine N-acetyltransferase [Glaciimonas sp.]